MTPCERTPLNADLAGISGTGAVTWREHDFREPVAANGG